MSTGDAISALSLIVQCVMVLIISPIYRKITSIEEKLDHYRRIHDCESRMCRHDGEIKGIREMLTNHEGRISKIEGQTSRNKDAIQGDSLAN